MTAPASIRVLPIQVASQIAAGEVVERPASVVKELLENALDAGAAQISISVSGAGRRLIEVADDGHGIPAAELPLAVERHATSKLTSAEDLFAIHSLGFRGEALASIGSVSRLTVTSCPAGEVLGARLQVEAGQVESVEPVGVPPGTVVRVEDLFYNVPARLKFLKKDVTERRQIDNLVTRYALAYPQVRVQLFQDGKAVLQTAGNGNRREILANMYSPEIARQMLAVDTIYDDFNLTGFIGPTGLTRANRREITFFVNGRSVQDSALTAALIQAYHTLLMVGRFPMAVLFVSLPAEAVDVNVHPAKAEVRFRDPGRVFADVQRAVRRSLLAHTPVPDIDAGRVWGQPAWSSDVESRPPWTYSESAGKAGAQAGPLPFHTAGPGDVPAQPELPAGRVPLLRLVGQVANSYLIAEGPDGLYLIDQHAAHERVLFERMMKQRAGEIASQALLEPETVELPVQQAGLLEDQLPLLLQLGFQVEHFGRQTYRVRALPALLAHLAPSAALRVLVEDFEEDETPLQAEEEARVIGRVCKRAAVKAGQVLSPPEQQALLRDLEACRSPRTCPHGRPTMIHLSVDLLERQFGRRGPR